MRRDTQVGDEVPTWAERTELEPDVLLQLYGEIHPGLSLFFRRHILLKNLDGCTLQCQQYLVLAMPVTIASKLNTVRLAWEDRHN